MCCRGWKIPSKLSIDIPLKKFRLPTFYFPNGQISRERSQTQKVVFYIPYSISKSSFVGSERRSLKLYIVPRLRTNLKSPFTMISIAERQSIQLESYTILSDFRKKQLPIIHFGE
jgi:hypothetical protein